MKYLDECDISDYELTEINTNRQELLFFYKLHGLNNGFSFKVLEFAEQEFGDKPKYNLIFDGVVYCDGLRHLNVGSGDDKGYIHYADPNCIKLIFEIVANLENEYCGSL